jgi:glycogen(starch) synthase
VSNLRILYVAGTEDAFDTFRLWKAAGKPARPRGQIAQTSQLYDVCHEMGATALVVTPHPAAPPEPLRDGRITVERRKNLDVSQGASSLLNPVRQLVNQAHQLTLARQIMEDVRRFDANVLITGDRPRLFLLAGLRRRGVKLIQSLNHPLWPAYGKRTLSGWAARALEGVRYAQNCDAILSVSDVVDRQVKFACAKAGSAPPPLVNFLPHFKAETRVRVAPPARGEIFRVLFSGGVGADQGVFKLLELARRFRAARRADIVFEICGTGPALEALTAQTRAAGLDGTFLIHGWCDGPRLRSIYQRSHAVVVPSTLDSVAATNDVGIDALLAGRPVITSAACQAAPYLRPATMEVPLDDIAGYESAILRLADDELTYQRLRRACEPACDKFLDPATSYAAALRHVLTAVAEGRPVASRRLPVDPLKSVVPARMGSARLGL